MPAWYGGFDHERLSWLVDNPVRVVRRGLDTIRVSCCGSDEVGFCSLDRMHRPKINLQPGGGSCSSAIQRLPLEPSTAFSGEKDSMRANVGSYFPGILTGGLKDEAVAWAPMLRSFSATIGGRSAPTPAPVSVSGRIVPSGWKSICSTKTCRLAPPRPYSR